MSSAVALGPRGFRSQTSSGSRSEQLSGARSERPSGPRNQAPSLFDLAGGEPTLDDALAGVWEGLAARAAARCPICGGWMEPVDAPQAGGQRAPAGARCTGCGSSLS
jgi:hypothetical protein